MNILIFPFNESHDFVLETLLVGLGVRVYKASSVRHLSEDVEYLPPVTQDHFIDDFTEFCKERNIDTIYSTHNIVFQFIVQNFSDKKIRVFGYSPHDFQSLVFMNISAVSEESEIMIKRYGFGNNDKLDRKFLIHLICKFNSVYGECSIEKFSALIAVIYDVIHENGDWVELGVLYGKSFIAPALINAIRPEGKVFAIDSWNSGQARQVSDFGLVSESSNNLDFNIVYSTFRMHFESTVLSNRTIIINKESELAFHDYTKESNNLITYLHIDANHDIEKVRTDFDNWSTRLAKNAWVIFDDYKWAYGSGPRVIADEILTLYGYNVKHAFFCGGALFIKLEVLSR
jgi:hypothetical protein